MPQSFGFYLRADTIFFRGITGSGKSFGLRLLTNQLLRLSSHSKKESNIAEQIKSLRTGDRILV